MVRYFLLRKAKMAFNRNGNIDTGRDIENSIEASNLMQFPSNWKRAKKPIFFFRLDHSYT